jgi:hypothetical protein
MGPFVAGLTAAVAAGCWWLFARWWNSPKQYTRRYLKRLDKVLRGD